MSKNMRIRMLRNCIVLMLFVMTWSASAQVFGGGLTLGFNASQIDGDELAGYNHLGLQAGVVGFINFNPQWNVQFEILYSERGSSMELFPGDTFDPFKLNTNYIEAPLIANFKDWLDEKDDYYKLHFQGGLSYGFLLSDNLSNEIYQPARADFNENDLSWLLGFTYYPSKNIGVVFRYTRSINRLFNNDKSAFNLSSLRGYMFSFRVHYVLFSNVN